uniref:DNA2/NAM7 helicase helicase domain-containing protein n=1 Tax=Panagrolaimus sp. ES5 TaxID=591445 RepID=A0AC34GEZ3_9BILA
MLKWKFLNTGLAQVTYYRDSGIATDKSANSTNFRNTLFRQNVDVMLIRHDPVTNEASEPVIVKISKEKFAFSETLIGFEIDPRYLLDRWKLETEHDLLKAEYTMEPVNLLSHLRAIFMKMENEYYLDFLLNEESIRSTIMEAFMPDSESNERIYQIPNKERETRKDKRIKPGDSTFAQFIARNEINSSKPIVIIDGPPQTGKTDLLSYIVPDILKSIITSPDHCHGKCFALVSPVYTLRNLVLKVKQHTKYQQLCHKIKILDLTVWPADENGSFLSVLAITLKKSIGDYDAQEKLRKAQTAFKSKVQAQNMEICDSFDSNNDTDLITSKELLIFQDAIK